MIISSSWRSFWKPLPPLKDKSLKLKDSGPRPRLHKRCSNYWSCWMNVPLISKSGRREFKNSSVFNIDHLYLRIKYAARTDEERLYPRTECTRTDSYFLMAFSMKSYIALVVVSFASKIIWFSRSIHWNVRYTTPLPSQWFCTCFPAQLIICVTLLATTNSWSY